LEVVRVVIALVMHEPARGWYDCVARAPERGWAVSAVGWARVRVRRPDIRDRARARRGGLLPYPVAFDGVPGGVRDPAAGVRVTDARSPLLNWPNVITARDFESWTGDRARNVPATFDPRYRTVLSMGDPGQTPTPATILAARFGKGTIIYTSLSLDRQLDAAHPGAARLMINLLAAGLGPERGR
jgi:hypothetical protein